MGLNCGIVGLPNVGKSTIFSALTSAPAEAANYPFCTIDPNTGVVSVPDPRLYEITKRVKPKKVVPAITEFVDIAGLVKGASKGEGLGNQFLGHIRQVDAIIHVVRCFDDENIVHVHQSIDPIRDIEIIHYELALADLETVEKRLSTIAKLVKSQDKKQATRAKSSKPHLEKLNNTLASGKLASSLNFSDEELELINDLHLITLKKQLYVCNVDEDAILKGNKYVNKVKEFVKKEGEEVIIICGEIESEIAKLDSDEEKQEFLESIGIKESGLDLLIKTAYRMLGLRTYFTAGEQEVRAWTFKEGMSAPQTASIIHTDFEKGFIKAEVYHYQDLIEHENEKRVKEKGLLRIEGKEYIVQDGDIMHFRFNV